MIEIERKFRLSNKQSSKIRQKLEDDHGSLKDFRQTDKVFLQGVNSFANFKRGQPVIRLRTANNITTLAFKRSVNEAGDTVEHELAIDSAETMEAILKEMDYRAVTTVDKLRTEVKDGEFTIVLDSVRDAGEFLEIEILTDREDDQSAAERRIMSKAGEFDLTEDMIELRKYDQLVSSST